MKSMRIFLFGLLFSAANLFGITTFSNLSVTANANGSATIVFTTSQPIAAHLNWGVGNVVNPTSNDTGGTNHTFTLLRLDPGVTFSYQAAAADGSLSVIQSFQTCTTGLNATSVQARINNYYMYGTWSVTWSSPVGGSPSLCGVPIASTANGGLDYLGSMTVQLGDSTKIVPNPSTWTVAMADVGNLAPVSVSQSLSGPSVDLSGPLQAVAAGYLQFVWYNPITTAFYPSITGSGNVTASGMTANQSVHATAGAAIATDGFLYTNIVRKDAPNVMGGYQTSFLSATWLWPSCIGGVSSATNNSCLDAGTGAHVWNPFTSADVLIGSGGTSAFGSLTGGTNNSAAMLVGTGASFGPTGSGTVTANAITGSPSITVNALTASSGSFGTTLGVTGLSTLTGGANIPSGATLTIQNGATLTCAGGATCPGVTFGTLTGGTNNAATMNVGTGSSLQYTGSGVVNANQFGGVSYTTQGNGTKLQLSTGTVTQNSLGKFDANGNIINSLFTDNGATGGYSGSGGFSVSGGPLCVGSSCSLALLAGVTGGWGAASASTAFTATAGQGGIRVDTTCLKAAVPGAAELCLPTSTSALLSVSSAGQLGLAATAADTVLMNATGGSAVPTAVAMPTCTSGANLYNTSTHTWSCVTTTTLMRHEDRAVCQGSIGGWSGGFPATNAGSPICDAAFHTGVVSLTAGVTTQSFYTSPMNVPTGYTNSLPIIIWFRTADTAHTATMQLQYACIAPGAAPALIATTFAANNLGSPITLTPSGTASAIVVNSTTQSVTCAAGNDLRINVTLTANSFTSDLYFSFVGLYPTASTVTP